VFARAKAKVRYANVLKTGVYDLGIYKFKPLEGDRAIKKAKVGSFLADLFMWITIIVLSARHFFL
jgi:hypothetical protein